jgi:SAM-dependent methyltransferase
MERGANADQIAYWNSEAGRRWTLLAHRTDALFEEMLQELLRVAKVAAGEKVVDLGCGCGGSLLALAELVGPQGSVAGIDVSEPMLELAEGRLRDARHSNVRLHQADAAVHPFEAGSFDLAFSRLGVMFFDEPIPAFANILGALRAGGRLAFVAFRGLPENPMFEVPLAAAAPEQVAAFRAGQERPGPLALADAVRTRGILEAAGFSAVRVQPRDFKLRFGRPGDLDAAAALAASLGPAARAIAAMPDEPSQDRARAAIRAALAPYETPEGVLLNAGMWFVTAEAPAD